MGNPGRRIPVKYKVIRERLKALRRGPRASSYTFSAISIALHNDEGKKSAYCRIAGGPGPHDRETVEELCEYIGLKLVQVTELTSADVLSDLGMIELAERDRINWDLVTRIDLQTYLPPAGKQERIKTLDNALDRAFPITQRFRHDIGVQIGYRFEDIMMDIVELERIIELTDVEVCRTEYLKAKYDCFMRLPARDAMQRWRERLEIEYRDLTDTSKALRLSDLLVTTASYLVGRFKVWGDCLLNSEPLWPNPDLDRRGKAHVRLQLRPPLSEEGLRRLVSNRNLYLAEGERGYALSSLPF